MSKKTIPTSLQPAFWLDEQLIDTNELVDALRECINFAVIIRQIVLNRALINISLPSGRQEELLKNFRKENKLEEDVAYQQYLKAKNINERILVNNISRPEKAYIYREERWGPRANSLYLKHKDLYDLFTYRRLQSANADVMQEVFFRIKDNEDTWEGIAPNFPGSEKDARQVLVPVEKIEAPLVSAMRKAGPGTVIRPIHLSQNLIVIAKLEEIQTSNYNNELRIRILNNEFNTWLNDECTKMINKLQFPA